MAILFQTIGIIATFYGCILLSMQLYVFLKKVYMKQRKIKCLCKHEYVNDCTVCVCERVMEIIRSHMSEIENDNWIPCSERLPEEEYSMFAKFKETPVMGYYTMFEKKSDEVNITYELEDGTRKTGTSYTLDGKWKIEKENLIVKKKVVAWQPLPEPYRAADKPDWKENMLNTFLAGH